MNSSGSAALRIVERIGRRLIIACSCGNYFLCAKRRAVCDNCGAEALVAGLKMERRDGSDRG